MPLTTTASNALSLTQVGSLTLPGAEISAFDAATKTLWVTSLTGLRVIDFSNPASPTVTQTITFDSTPGSSNDVNSVAIKNGIVAVAVNASTATNNGKVFLFNTAGTLLKTVDVGAVPDNLVFTPDGTKILVANEGESNLDTAGAQLTTNPVGSISIINISGGAANATVQTAGFDAYNSQAATLISSGVRLFTSVPDFSTAGTTVAQDLEPEYIAISPDGTKALVTLQEANSIAIVDIATATVTDIKPLGMKDFSGLSFDGSDRDGYRNAVSINFQTGTKVFGLYQPDAIASFTTGGQTYYIIANEGDDRNDFLNPDETTTVGAGNYDLDDTLFPNEAFLKSNAGIGRLTVSNLPGRRGDTDGDGDIDPIISYGGRSFSILDSNGNRVFDSGSHIDVTVAANSPRNFDDTRSDNKGSEPEGVTTAVIAGKVYAFVGLERFAGTMVYDVTNPTDPTFVTFASSPAAFSTASTTGASFGTTGGAFQRPEGGIFISATDSPTGKALYVVSNEGLGTAGSNVASIVTYEVAEAGNTAPTITSNLGGATASIDLAENGTAVTTVTATDSPGTTLVYSIAGGADAAKFAINATTGALTFKTAPNFEMKGDAGGDNVYDVVVRASDGTLSDDQAIAVSVTNQPFTLQLLSFYAESGVLSTETAYRAAGIVEGFKNQMSGNTLVLTNGDTFIPGPYSAAGTDNSIGAVVPGSGNAPARPDIAVLNAIGVDAAAIGNHEFDLGSNVFQSAITPSGSWVGALFPYLSANLNFSGDSFLSARFTNTLAANSGLEEASSLKGRVAPSAVKTLNGEKIGIIGLTPQNLASLSSPTGAVINGGSTISAAVAAAQVQAAIDDLVAQGVNKIVLTTDSNNIAFDTQVVNLTRGIDLVVAGGSHLQSGDSNDAARPGESFAQDFPIVTTDLDGNKALIVSSDVDYKYVNRLVVGFTADGKIDLSTLDNTVNGAYNATDANVAAAWGTTVGNLGTTAYAAGTSASKVKTITDAIGNVITAKDSTLTGTPGAFAYSNVYLEGERNQVRFQETNLGNLTADANAAKAREVLGLDADVAVISIKNGGGIRNAVGFIDEDGNKLANVANAAVGKPGGAISQLDVENSLRFNNGLMVFETTAQGLLNILNSPNTVVKNNGGFIQIGGVRFSYDATKAVGSRVQDVVLVNEAGQITARIADNGVVLSSAPSLIRGIVLNFTAQGGDSYAFKANADNFRYVKADGTLSAIVPENLNFTDATVITNYTGTTGLLGEQKVLSDYMASKFGTPGTAYNVADTVEALDTRIQNQAVRTDTVLIGDTLLADATTDFAENATATVFQGVSTGLTGSISYSLTGADKDLFNVSNSGVVTFKNAPNFENKLDAGANSTYDVRVVASNGTNTTVQDVAITVTDVSEAPVISTNGGGATASVSLAENIAVVTTVQANDQDAGTTLTYSIVGGADQGKFAINATTGALSFVNAPNFERPTDADSNNIYSVTVRASDGTLTDDQAIAVTVTDVADTKSSQTAYLQGTQSNVSFQSIITTGDATSKTGGGTYLFGGIPDGTGMFDNGDGTVTVLVNHELGNTVGTVRDHGAKGAYVSKLIIDKTDLSVISGSDAFSVVKLWNPSTQSFETGNAVVFTRFCSADLAPTNAFYNPLTGKGTQDKIFLTGEESGAEGRVLGVVASGSENGTAYELAGLGKFSHENAVANGFATQDKTIVLGTDDTTPGQVYVYIGTKTDTGSAVDKAGLTNGKLYGFKVANLDGSANKESGTAIANGAFTLVDLGDVKNKTGATLQTESEAAGVTSFLRPEDISWDPTNPARGYFVTTNAFGSPSRLYQFTFTDITQPELGGTITAVLDGTEGQQMLDNITVNAEGKVILQEDVGNQAHNGKIWQYDPVTDKLTLIAQHDPARFITGGANFLTQDEESSGIIDVTATFGDANTKAYLLVDQAHYPATGPNSATLVEGGQLLLMKVALNAPVITSNAGGASAAISVAENGTAVTTASSTDDAMDTVTYSLSGTDAAFFNINANTGVITFKNAPNFEVRADAGANNVYNVVLTASDGIKTDTQALAITVTNVNEAPTITSNGGSPAGAVSVAENVTAVTTVTATDPDAGTTLTYSLSGTDAALFNLNNATGVLTFKAAPDYEAPADAGSNNVYNVVITASDGSITDTQALAVTVTRPIYGSAVKDTVSGTDLDERLLGLGGNDVLIGGGGNDQLEGGEGNDRLTGGLGNDRLDGGAGADKMNGGLGDDVYIVETVGDTVTEGARQGNDTVYSSISFKVANNVETLILTGNDAINGTGNSTANTIRGNSGANVLNGGLGNDLLAGGLGNDTLTGGRGADLFLFDSLPNGTTNVDLIRDFSRKDGDHIQLSKAVFAGLGALGDIEAQSFFASATATAAQDADDRLVYNTATGQLFYDADGLGGQASVQIATIGATTHAALTYTDFQIVI